MKVLNIEPGASILDGVIALLQMYYLLDYSHAKDIALGAEFIEEGNILRVKSDIFNETIRLEFTPLVA